METAYFVIPAYNEEANIYHVLTNWYPIVEQCGSNSRLLVIDDGSSDHTYSVIEEFSKTHPQLIPLTKPNNGHGATILYGYHYALEHGADYIFQTDSDGQTLPSEFAPFWALRKDYDMVIGNRKKRQDGYSRLFVTKVLKLVLAFCFHVFIPDANTPYRLMKAETLKKYMNIIPANYNLTNVLISVIFARKNCRVHYIPITFRPRQGGVNSINMKKINIIGRQAIHDFYTIKKSL